LFLCQNIWAIANTRTQEPKDPFMKTCNICHALVFFCFVFTINIFAEQVTVRHDPVSMNGYISPPPPADCRWEFFNRGLRKINHAEEGEDSQPQSELITNWEDYMRDNNLEKASYSAVVVADCLSVGDVATFSRKMIIYQKFVDVGHIFCEPGERIRVTLLRPTDADFEFVGELTAHYLPRKFSTQEVREIKVEPGLGVAEGSPMQKLMRAKMRGYASS
jgi:hypothetical protein